MTNPPRVDSAVLQVPNTAPGKQEALQEFA